VVGEPQVDDTRLSPQFSADGRAKYCAIVTKKCIVWYLYARFVFPPANPTGLKAACLEPCLHYSDGECGVAVIFLERRSLFPCLTFSSYEFGHMHILQS